MMKVPIVDEREEFLPELQVILRGSDMDVDFARTFEGTIALLAVNSYDIVIVSDKKALI
jgi:hypothetical protein